MAADYLTDVDIRRALLDRADRFCTLTGMSRTSLGIAALRDGSSLTDIQEGRDIRLRTYQRLMTWFDQNWPKDSSPPTQPEAVHE